MDQPAIRNNLIRCRQGTPFDILSLNQTFWRDIWHIKRGQTATLHRSQVPRRAPGRAVRRQVGAGVGHPRHGSLHPPHPDCGQFQLLWPSHRCQGHRR